MRKGMQKWLLGMMLVVAVPADAEIWVKDFQGQPEQYQLQRNGKNQKIRHYLVLNNGDQIIVKGKWLELESGDGTVVPVKPSDSPYQVLDADKAPSVLTNLVSWAGEWFKKKVDDGTAQPEITVVAVVTRSLARRTEIAPITLPLTPKEPVRLVAGLRPVHLAWKGGAPPFRVQLIGRDNKGLVFNQQGLMEPRYESPLVKLTPGIYRLTIADQDRNINVELEVVASKGVPKPPAELAATASADSARETIYALWLSAQGKQWILEAYQRAVLWQNQYLPARWLMYSLEKGVRPEPPTQKQGL